MKSLKQIPRMLVVDSEVGISEMFAILFRSCGYEALSATSVEQARLLLDTFQPHIILAEHYLWDGCACDIARTIRSNPSTSGIPILLNVLPGLFKSANHRVFEAGASKVIYKPQQPQDIMAEVKRLVSEYFRRKHNFAVRDALDYRCRFLEPYPSVYAKLEAETAPSRPRPFGALNKIRILIAEPENIVGKMLTTFLRMRGYDAISTRSTEEAELALKEHAFDVIVLTQVQFGHLTGFELCSAIKEGRTKKNSPVIMLYDHPCVNKGLARQRGVDAYCERPIHFESVLGHICAVLAPDYTYSFIDDQCIDRK